MDKTKGKTIGLLAMVVVVTIYGVSYISRAVISEYLPTVVILGIQMAIMTILFTGYNLLTKKKMKVKTKDWGLIILSGLFGTTFFHGFTILSVTSIGATVSSLLFGFAAVFALIMEIVFFHRKKTRLGILGILISLVGGIYPDGGKNRGPDVHQFQGICPVPSEHCFLGGLLFPDRQDIIRLREDGIAELPGACGRCHHTAVLILLSDRAVGFGKAFRLHEFDRAGRV